LAARTKLLWLGDEPAPPNVREATRQRWDLVPYSTTAPLGDQLRAVGLAVACPNGRANDPHELEKLLDAMARAPAVTVVLLPEEAKVAWGVLSRREGKFVCIRQDASPKEIADKLAAAESLQGAIRSLEMELAAARKVDRPTAKKLEELDEELRIAARLQRDFLPRRLPELGGVRFGVLYRPLGWVSGDIYDVVRLDETHVGFYVADAVGHGMPAALLTMFVKQALQTKRIAGHTYEIVPPHVSLGQLNAAICQQGLPSCQFCTAVYCVLDVSDRTLTYARAGHPEPLLIHRDGTVTELSAPGSLLGVFPDESYTSVSLGLSPGDRLVLYTDGAEDALAGTTGDREMFKRRVGSLAGKPVDETLLQITAWIDELPRDRGRRDDITIVAVDVTS